MKYLLKSYGRQKSKYSNVKIDLDYSLKGKHFYGNNPILNELARCRNTNHRKKWLFLTQDDDFFAIFLLVDENTQ